MYLSKFQVINDRLNVIREELFYVFFCIEKNSFLDKYNISEQINIHLLHGFDTLEQSPLKGCEEIAFKGFTVTEYQLVISLLLPKSQHDV